MLQLFGFPDFIVKLKRVSGGFARDGSRDVVTACLVLPGPAHDRLFLTEVQIQGACAVDGVVNGPRPGAGHVDRPGLRRASLSSSWANPGREMITIAQAKSVPSPTAFRFLMSIRVPFAKDLRCRSIFARSRLRNTAAVMSST